MARKPSPSPAVFIEHGGAFATVQDLGRPTLRHAGLPGGGAVDPMALRTANLLVGNPEDAAVLECALVGPKFRFDQDTDIAVTGATIVSIPGNRRLRIAAGTRLNLSHFQVGAYACVAFAGGLDVPRVLESRSTDVRLAFGGFQGRVLRAGDRLELGRAVLPAEQPALHIAPVGAADRDLPIRIVDGKDAEAVDQEWINEAFTISSKSDRVGVRLDGPKIAANARGDAPSAIVLPGTIQLPGDGVRSCCSPTHRRSAGTRRSPTWFAPICRAWRKSVRGGRCDSSASRWRKRIA
ncbi:MAG: allophanate hydrolase subunit 2 family protein [Phycisphaerales bacterium]|nr:allophanate hydrolase subunit 2 family protein [Phycisphaerales bacterium]